MSQAQLSQQSLDLLKAAMKKPNDALAKSWSQSGTATSGITAYDLEMYAKILFPVLTPLRNKIARVVGGSGIQANWRAVTGINTSQMSAGVTEGQRSGAIAHTTADYTAAFRFLGLEDYYTFESDWAAQGFDDVKALTVSKLLQATMIQEEFLDLGGNNSVALGTCPTPTVSDNATGGTLAYNTQYDVLCVAMTLAGYQQAAGYANGTVNDSVAISGLTLNRTVTRTNMDSTTDVVNGGLSQVSAAGTVTTANDSNNTHSVGAHVSPVRGAVAYAWFWGVHASGQLLLGAVTTTNSVLITATATGTQNVTAFTTGAADNSTRSLEYDGMLTQIMKSGSGAYFTSLATGTDGTGTKLTTNGSAGISQIDTALQAFWNNYRISPQVMYVNAQQLMDISTIILNGGGGTLFKLNTDANGGANVTANRIVSMYFNPITGTKISIEVHPNMPPGTIMFWSDEIPYPLSGVSSVVRKLLRKDYYQIEWPLRTRRYEYGVYFDGVLQNYFPPAFGVLNNIAAGH